MLSRSLPGHPPTADEIALVSAVDVGRVSDAMGQWALIAQRISLPSTLVVLDEFAGELLRIPSRASFLSALHRPARDEAIRKAVAAGFPIREVAAAHGISRQLADYILAKPVPDTCGRRVIRSCR